MSTGVGVGVVVAILVLLPLAALLAARRWRDPPREKWAATVRPGVDPGVAEFHIRKQYGLRDEKRWEQVRRAVVKGEAAPDDLRPAARQYAQAMLAALDAQPGPWGRRRPPRWVRILIPAGAVVVIAAALVLRPWFGLFYLLYWTALTAQHSPWLRRRQRRRYEAALTVNS